MKKKFISKTLLLLGLSTLAFSASSLLLAKKNYQELTPAYAEDANLDAYKGEAKARLNDCTNVDELPEAIKGEIQSLLEYAFGEIDKATRAYEINVVVDYTEQRIEEIIAEYNDPEARELKNYKKAKIDYINTHFSLDDYDEQTQEKLRRILDNGIDNIEYADSIVMVDYFFNMLLHELNINSPQEEDDPKTVEEARELALIDIECTVRDYPYAFCFEHDINYLVSKTKKKINEASTIDAVKEELKKFHDSFNEFPNEESIVVNIYRSTLINQYINYEYERVILTGFDDKENVLPIMDEEFEKEMKNAHSLTHLLQVYENGINSLNELMPLPDDQLVGGKASNNQNNQKNTGLIIACSIEGAVILTLGGYLAYSLLKKKKEKTTK